MHRSYSDEELANYRGVVIVGASGAGKSTLLKHLRQRISTSSVDFPIRYTTREPREDDDPAENSYINRLDLDKSLSNGTLLLCWSKPISSSLEEYYAFRVSIAPVVVLGGNEALLDNKQSIAPLPSVLNQLLVVAVWCDEAARIDRLFARSPELAHKKEELSVRTRPASRAVLEAANLVVDNTGGFSAEDLSFLCDILSRMASLRGPNARS